MAKPQRAEIISVPSPDVELVKNRREVDGDTLSKYIEGQFRGVCTTLRHLLPLIAEMKRKFSLLPRGRQVDGTYRTIRECRSFKEWVETKLKKSERTVYYLLAGGNPQNEKARLGKESVTKQASPAARLANAIEEVKNGKSAIEVLRDEVQEIVDNTSESLQGNSKHEKREECVQALGKVINHLDSAVSEAHNVSFPVSEGSNAFN
ncbi:MAG: hypothetical protein WBC04_05740 [Candidatus Acidiferrales bacterium]